jgi:CAAX protease family protein
MNESTLKQTGASNQKRIAFVVASLLVALVFWYVAFEAPFSNFWVKMAVATLCIAAISLFFAGGRARELFRFRPRHIGIGIGSAAVLYGVFWVGKLLLTAVSPLAQSSISSVYAPRSSVPLAVIALILLFVTSPAEEVFWRGMIQRFFMERTSPWLGFVLGTLCYTGVHVVTLNVPLILAAFTAGFVWGIIYRFERSLVPVIISHSLWATTIFVLFPVS